MSTPRFLVYVDVPVVTYVKTAFVVVDEGDLTQQLVAHEVNFRNAPYLYSVQKDQKTKKPILHQLNKDWDLS